MYLVDSSKTKASHEIQYSNPSTYVSENKVTKLVKRINIFLIG